MRRRLPPTLVVGGLIVGLVILTALVSVLWTPSDPNHAEVADRLKSPSSVYLLGTDQAALYRGPTEDAIMRLSDLLLAFPAILLALLFAAVFRPSAETAMAAIGIALVPVFARVVRGAGLQVLQQDYVTIVRTYGAGNVWIFMRHLLPNVSSVLIVQATVAFAIAILAEAALSYLGLGTPPPTPSWGRMLSESQTYLNQAPLLAVWPGASIAVSVLGFNLLGDGLRDLLDPKLVERLPVQG